ncbi:hypothetical protein MGI18_18575 [Bacillus sp. OVS6]|nr:hypothetical protein MGI18_18575 [Bacillus sp. OVS6]
MYKTSIRDKQVIFKKDRKMSDERFLLACRQLETLESLLDFEHERLILIKDPLQNTIIIEKRAQKHAPFIFTATSCTRRSSSLRNSKKNSFLLSENDYNIVC